MPYMVTFTITIPPMLAYIPYMDPMGMDSTCVSVPKHSPVVKCHAPAVEACHQHELPIPHSGTFTKGKHNKLQDVRMSMRICDIDR